jgi:hypothetical protein
MVKWQGIVLIIIAILGKWRLSISAQLQSTDIALTLNRGRIGGGVRGMHN